MCSSGIIYNVRHKNWHVWRGVRPSCNTRRMVETAAHLADHVLPRLPVRQWVLLLPERLRYYLQHDREALNSARRIFLDTIEQHLRSHCPGARPKVRIGAVAFIHRFGSSLNQHPDFHDCVIDGVFEPDPEQGVRFIAAEELDAQDAEAVQTRVRRRILCALTASPRERILLHKWLNFLSLSIHKQVVLKSVSC